MQRFATGDILDDEVCKKEGLHDVDGYAAVHHEQMDAYA